MIDEGGSGTPCKYYGIVSYDRHTASCTYKSSVHNSCSMFNQACVKKSVCIRISSTVNHLTLQIIPVQDIMELQQTWWILQESFKKCKKGLPQNKNMITSPRQWLCKDFMFNIYTFSTPGFLLTNVIPTYTMNN